MLWKADINYVTILGQKLWHATIKHSYNRPSLEQLKSVKDFPYISENNRMQSHRMSSGPSLAELFHNFQEGLKVDPGLPYIPLDEPIPMKFHKYSVNSSNVYSVTIDGYYYFPGEGYIPHIKLTPIS
jgi:hypothetical protein